MTCRSGRRHPGCLRARGATESSAVNDVMKPRRAEPADAQEILVARIGHERSLLAGSPLARAIKRRLILLQKLRVFIRDDRRKRTSLNWRHTLRAWRHGFLRFHYRLYGLDAAGDPLEYVSDLACYLTHDRINGRFNELVSNKYAFGRLLRLLGAPVPDIKGVITRGAFRPLDGVRALTATEFLRQGVTPGQHLALKPIWGFHGYGFFGLARDGGGYRVDGEAVATARLAELIGGLDDYLVSDFVNQGEFSRRFHPRTVNTIRIVTLWDGDRPFVARAVLRIGTSRSFPVDNFQAGHGGLSVLIDMESGSLGLGALADAGGKPEWHTHHPESGVPIAGVVIPFWGELRDRVLDYASCLAFIRSIGWDIVLTDDGFSILEGNPTPGMPVLQVHGPMLADPRVRRFYESI